MNIQEHQTTKEKELLLELETLQQQIQPLEEVSFKVQFNHLFTLFKFT